MTYAQHFFSLLLLGTLAGLAAPAQQYGGRTVRGTVIDAQGRPLSSAVVYLFNERTRMVRTSYCGRSGAFRFSGLKHYDDYIIHAEYGRMTSDKQAISSSDQKSEIVLTLKVDRQHGLARVAGSAKEQDLSACKSEVNRYLHFDGYWFPV